MSVTLVLWMLLLVPFIAAGAGLLLTAALVLHVSRSFDLGASLRAVIDQRWLRARIQVVPPQPHAEIGGA